ncbi:MAG: type II toxin-antitoxin system RelB/DinJ family antitoxin [Selenomonadaceae bacterium]|nr:type II toxin-antitoxin system RelB/DinJ family antitoxin [Selenomonadaceae bacterium]MBR3745583.1 type II toxin-antitoxin system RelB/DinJ family antitoxin [Selenomonadaceae bacterium]
MANEVTVEVKIDADLKEAAEKIFTRMDMSFSEAISAFAKETITQNRMPFYVKPKRKSAFGSLAKFANPKWVGLEEIAWERFVIEKYGKDIN